jgi:hypothetical protein
MSKKLRNGRDIWSIFGKVVPTAIFPLLSLTVQAQDSLTPRIINGENASKNYPWMVALVASEKDDSTEAHFCGGSLIGSQHILTAAHCVEGILNPLDLQVLIGVRELPFARGDRREILGFKIHPKYDPITIENDLAIIKLAKPVSNQPISLGRQGDILSYSANTSGLALGWGTTDARDPILPTILQQASLPIESDDVCSAELGRYYKPQSMMCAGKKASTATATDGVDTCSGDSGGPLVITDKNGELKQVGVTSWGFGCGSAKTRGVYAEVAPNESFVLSYPDAPPTSIDGPLLKTASADGIAYVGQALSCLPGKYLGDAVTDFKYRWYMYEETQIPSSGATTSVYTPGQGDLSKTIGCSVVASNAGGSTLELFSPAMTVVDLPITPTPASSNESAKDVTAPSITLTKLFCRSSHCLGLFSVGDTETGVSSVTATLEQILKSKCARGVKCSKGKTTSLKSESLGGGLWSFIFKRNAKASGKVTLTVQATDGAGNLGTLQMAKRIRQQ